MKLLKLLNEMVLGVHWNWQLEVLWASLLIWRQVCDLGDRYSMRKCLGAVIMRGGAVRVFVAMVLVLRGPWL